MTVDQELEEAIPLLALDALDPWEELAVRAHVEGCAECAALLEQYLEIAKALALGVAPAVPTRRLRRRILRRAAAARGGEAAGPRRRSLRRPVAAALAAAALVSAMVPGWRRGDGIDRGRGTQAGDLETLAAVLDAGAEAIPLRPAAAAPDASGTVLTASRGKIAALVVRGMGDPGAGTYVVWAVSGVETRRLAEFRPDHSGAAVVGLGGGVGAGTPLAVTLERGPVRQSPAGPAILTR